MTTEEKRALLEDAEEEAAVQLKKSGIYLLETSILRFDKSSLMDMLLAVSNMQTAMELLLKAYVCRAYGFENILMGKVRGLREHNHTAYVNELKRGQIKTLGFDGLKSFLKEKADTFAPAMENGGCPCFGIEYDDLEDRFRQFQTIRNAFLHLGVQPSDVDTRWLSTDFSCMLIVFVSLLLRELDAMEEAREREQPHTPSVYADDGEVFLWSTPIDILKRHLSPAAIRKLKDTPAFMENLYDFAADGYGGALYVCPDCGREAAFLDVDNGFVKCVACGECFSAEFTDCAVCHSKRTVVYDGLNMDSEFNQNIMPGYCYRCQKHPKVYRCPECGCVYSYSHKAAPESFFWDCCKKRFRDRGLPAYADC